MDSKELRGIMEAYSQMYAPQEDTEQLDEISYGLALRASKAADIKRGKLAHAGDKEGASEKAAQAARLYKKQAAKRLNRENFELWVDSLVEEGYDLSEYTWDEMFDIYLDEAEGSYGQTPKARAAMGKVAIARREKPASEYSQKGEKTRKVKEIEKHTRRIDNGPDAGNRGKKSTKPRWSGFAGKSGRGKLDQDSRDYSRETSAEYGSGTSGSGTVTKNPKKLRKQKAMGEIGEGYDIFDVVLEFLQVEGFAETLEEAEWMMANVIDEEAIEIVVGEGYQRNPEKGEKEDKKYAPVRGEKTPMPPRGDKRREDFEKWYRTQMGR